MSFFNPQDFHFDIPEIKKFSESPPEDTCENSSTSRSVRHEWNKRNTRLKKPNISKKLADIVDYAYENCEVYQELYRACGYKKGDIRTAEDLKHLPILTRAYLSEIDIKSRLAKNHKELYWTFTSGSTGVSLQHAYGMESLACETVDYYEQFEKMLGHKLDPNRWIYNIHMSRGWVSSLDGKYPTFTLSEIPDLNQLLEHLKLLKPAIVCMLSSQLQKISPIASEFKNIGIEFIAVNSESSTLLERKAYEKIYGVPIYDEYSTCEVGIIASEYANRKYHVNTEGVFLELLPESDHIEWSQTIVTDLRNKTMPLIRYDQGDTIKNTTSIVNLMYGNAEIFSEFMGRKGDFFTSLAGEKIPSGSIENILDTIFTMPNLEIDSFRLTECAINDLEMQVKLKNDSQNLTALHDAINRLNEGLTYLYKYQIHAKLKLYDTLPPLTGYKRRKVISNVINHLA